MDKKVSVGIGAFCGAFAAVLCVTSVNGCGRRGDALAIVNGEPINMSEFYVYLQNKPDVRVITQNGTADLSVEGSLGFQALRDLIGHQVELQIAKEKGLYPSPAEVDAELATQLKLNPNYLVSLMSRGLTLEVVKKSLTLDLAQEKLLTQGITVTADEAKAYVKSHPDQFMEPEKADVSVIFVKNKDSEAKVDQELATGNSFNSVAVRYSEAPTARAYNGKLTDPDNGPAIVTTLPQQVRDAITKISAPGVSDWTPMSGGFAKLYVAKRFPSKPTPMDATRIDLLRRAMAKERGAAKHNVQDMILRKLRDSKVDVVQEQYRSPWKQAVQELKNSR